MEATRRSSLFRRMGDLDLSLCLLFNRGVHRRHIQRFFAAVSRLGDGVFWYLLIASLPVTFGRAGVVASLQMVAVGLTGVLLYRSLKHRFLRQRPFVSHPLIRLGAPPLDEYSFPSGHTLHAVAFTLVAVGHFPVLAWLLVPFATLVALSRMVLGLHYPSDVLMGAAIGATLAWASFLVVP